MPLLFSKIQHNIVWERVLQYIYENGREAAGGHLQRVQAAAMQLHRIVELPEPPYVSRRFYRRQIPQCGKMMLLNPSLVPVLLLEDFYSIRITGVCGR